MTLFAIASVAGDPLGVYDADSADEALDNYVADCGFANVAEAAAMLGKTVEGFTADLVIAPEGEPDNVRALQPGP